MSRLYGTPGAKVTSHSPLQMGLCFAQLKSAQLLDLASGPRASGDCHVAGPCCTTRARVHRHTEARTHTHTHTHTHRHRHTMRARLLCYLGLALICLPHHQHTLKLAVNLILWMCVGMCFLNMVYDKTPFPAESEF